MDGVEKLVECGVILTSTKQKSAERLEWEKEWDCIKKMKEWLIETGLANDDERAEIEAEAKEHVRISRGNAWEKYIAPIKEMAADMVGANAAQGNLNPYEGAKDFYFKNRDRIILHPRARSLLEKELGIK